MLLMIQIFVDIVNKLEKLKLFNSNFQYQHNY